MLPLIGLAASLVPELIRLIGGDKTNALAGKVSDVVAAVAGTQDEKQASAKLADPAVAAELRTRLAEIALEAHKVQAQVETDERQTELEKLKASLASTQDARSLLTTLADKNNPIAWGAPVVSIIIGIGFFIIMGMAMFGGKDLITPDNSNIVYTLVGTMATAFATTISFWLGSSQGSRDKDATVRQLQLSHAEQTKQLVGMVQQQAASEAPNAAANAAAGPPVPANDVLPVRPQLASNFSNCLLEVLHMEGSFSDDKRDPGGPTNFGITRATLAEARGVPPGSISEEAMKALTFDEASRIYQSEYWHVLRCEEVPPGVDLMLFHFGVNAGNKTSAGLLQAAVGTDRDGIVGRQTVAAACRAEPAKLIDDLTLAQIQHYKTLDNFGTYGNGWINRVQRAQKVAKAMLIPAVSTAAAA